MSAFRALAASMLDSVLLRHSEFTDAENQVILGQPITVKQSDALASLFRICMDEANKLSADLCRAEEEQQAAEAARKAREEEEESQFVADLRSEAAAVAAQDAGNFADEDWLDETVSIALLPSIDEITKEVQREAREQNKAVKVRTKAEAKAEKAARKAAAKSWRAAQAAREADEVGSTKINPGNAMANAATDKIADLDDIRSLLNAGPPPSHRQGHL